MTWDSDTHAQLTKEVQGHIVTEDILIHAHLYHIHHGSTEAHFVFFNLGAFKSATSSEQHRKMKWGVSVFNVGQTH